MGLLISFIKFNNEVENNDSSNGFCSIYVKGYCCQPKAHLHNLCTVDIFLVAQPRSL